MFYLLLFTLFISIQISNCGLKRCNNKLCNNHGICRLSIQNKPVCTCVPGVFTGEKCDGFVDHCPNKYCDTHPCVDYPGGYQCECGIGMAGQNCSSKADEAEHPNPILLYNHVVELGDDEVIIIFFKTLPKLDMLFKLNTEDKMIAVEFPLTKKHITFNPVDNIKRKAEEYNIRGIENTTAKSGYYIAISYKVQKTSDYKLNFNIRHVDTGTELYSWRFGVLSAGSLLTLNIFLFVLSVLFSII